MAERGERIDRLPTKRDKKINKTQINNRIKLPQRNALKNTHTVSHKQ